MSVVWFLLHAYVIIVRVNRRHITRPPSPEAEPREREWLVAWVIGTFTFQMV